MKTILHLLVFFIFIIHAPSFGQTNEFICATPEDTTPDPVKALSYSIDPNDLDDFDPIVFNVYYWGIKKDTDFVTEEMVLKATAELNFKYNAGGVFFKYLGFDHILSPRFSTMYTSCTHPNDTGSTSCIDAFYDFVDANLACSTDSAINIYAPEGTVGFGGLADQGGLRSVVHFSTLGGERILSHELGHIFGLKHTFLNWDSNLNCEYVSREEFLPNGDPNPDFNAKDKGDKVVDTGAVPNFLRERCRELGYPPPYTDCSIAEATYIEDCSYTGSGTDCNDPISTPYAISASDIRNGMGYGPIACGTEFTTGQYIRLREIVNLNIGHYGRVMNTVASLYEPYSGSYPPYYPHAEPWELPLFQPGFEYHFVECCCEYPEPAPFGTIFTSDPNNIIKHVSPYETNYGTIFHPNHSAIRIIQVDNSNQYSSIQMCYDNYMSPPIIGGSITKFLDEVLNTNVTVNPQDSTAINNPRLVDDLQQGLYKIEKEYIDGTRQQTVIHKRNN